MITRELEFDEVELAEAPTSIGAGLSLLAGSAEPGVEPPPRNKTTTKIKAKHRNLTNRLNAASSRPTQAPPTSVICFPRWTPWNSTQLDVRSNHL